MQITKKELGRYIGPGIIGLLFNSLYIVVDGIFVAKILGSDALAAVTVVVPVVEFLIALSLMISVGCGVYISINKGKGNIQLSRNYFNHGLLISVVLAIFITIFSLIFKNQIVSILGSTEKIHAEAVEYFVWFIAFVPFFVLNYALGTWVRNDGKPELAMAGQIIGAVLNIVLDYIFMAPLQMGIKGAAIATGLGPVVGILILIPHFLLKQGDLYIEKITVKFKIIREIIIGGIPAFTMEFALGLTTFFCNLFLSRKLQENGLAAFGVIGYINLILLSVFLGTGQGTQPLISKYYGVGDNASVSSIYIFSVKTALITGVLGYVLLFISKPILVSIFLSASNIELFNMTLKAINIFFIALPIVGINVITSSLFASTQSYVSSILISLARSAVFLVPALWAMSKFSNPMMIWLGVPIAEIAAFVLAVVLLRNRGAISIHRRKR